MRRLFFVVAVLLSMGLLSYTFPEIRSSQNQVSAKSSEIDLQEARDFSDSMVAFIIENNYRSIYLHLETELRDSITENDLPTMFDNIYSYYGKPFEAEFKCSEKGFKWYLNGRQKPMRKFWYALRTSKCEKGTYFLFVDVVPEEDHLACTAFSIVAFLNNDVPESLQ